MGKPHAFFASSTKPFSIEQQNSRNVTRALTNRSWGLEGDLSAEPIRPLHARSSILLAKRVASCDEQLVLDALFR